MLNCCVNPLYSLYAPILPVCLQCKHHMHQCKYHKCKHQNIIHALTVTLASDTTAHMSTDNFVVRKHLRVWF